MAEPVRARRLSQGEGRWLQEIVRRGKGLGESMASLSSRVASFTTALVSEDSGQEGMLGA